MLSPAPARSVIKPQPRATAVIDWRELAACRGWVAENGSDPWFPEHPNTEGAYQTAKTICGGCPVAAQCLETAMDEERSIHGRQRHGMFAGLTPEERHHLYKRRARHEREEKERRAS